MSATATPSPRPASFVEPRGTAPPDAFVPASATFVSDRTGWVLGCEGSCADDAHPLAVLRTHDAGRTWVRLTAPETGADGVYALRFANLRDGFAYGRAGLWVTHDGAATWRRSSFVDPIRGLEAARGQVWLLDATAQLWRGPVAGSTFTRAAEPETSDVLVLHGDSVFGSTYAGHGRSLLTFVDATHEAGRAGMPCTDDGSPLLAARSARALFLVCDDDGGRGDGSRSAWLSADRGETWTRLANPGRVTMRSLVAATPGALFVATDGELLASHDDGRHWRPAVEIDGLVDLGFEGPRLGFVVDALDTATMRVTHDDGRSWQTVDFRRTGSS